MFNDIRKVFWRLTGVILFISAFIVTKAQIDTDRPAFTSTTSTVKTKNLQAEMGVSLSQGNYYSDTLSYLSAPSLSLRYGVSQNTELRLLLPSLGLDLKNGATEANNLEFGFKTKVVGDTRYNLSAIVGVFINEKPGGWISLSSPQQFGWNIGIPMVYGIDRNHRLKSEIRFTSGTSFFDISTYSQSLVFNKSFNPALVGQVEYVFNYKNGNNSVSEPFQLTHLVNLSAQYEMNKRCMIDGTISNLLGVRNEFNPLQKNIGVSLGLAYAIV